MNASIEVVPSVATMIFKKQSSVRTESTIANTLSNDSYLDATSLNSGSSKPPALSARIADSIISGGGSSKSPNGNAGIAGIAATPAATASAPSVGVIGVLRTSSKDEVPVLRPKEKEAKPAGNTKKDNDDDLMSFLSDDANFEI